MGQGLSALALGDVYFLMGHGIISEMISPLRAKGSNS